MSSISDRPSANPERLAPSVEPGWVRAFVTEQNLRGVMPRVIGDQLATVESHVRESGEPASEAFGDPVGYARALPEGERRRLDRRTVLELVLGLAGMVLVLAGFTAWLADSPVRITTGYLAVLGLTALGTAALLLRPTALLRLVVDRPLLAWGVMITPFAVFVACLLLLRTEIATLPVLPVMAVGALALAASSVLAAVNPVEDEITGPGEVPRRSAVSRRVGVLLYPLLTLGVMAISWVPTLFL
ncbi:hypothetical protein [Serinicoccus hydrothermalis]|nr:hypothetical protein [Serinicoccus hydrothermalis]